MSGTLSDAALRLTRPDVTPAELMDFAVAFPDLRPAVAAHPGCYPELREWIAQVTPRAPAAPPVAPSAPATRPVPPPPLQAPPLDVASAAPAGAVQPSGLAQLPVRRVRLPWAVAAVAVVVALASVGALVAGRSSGSGAGGGERGFATPEAAVDFFVARVAAGDIAGASEAFAVERVVDGFSFRAFSERINAVTPQTWLPTSSDGYRAIDVGLRRGEIASQLRFMVETVVAPDRDFTVTEMLGDGVTAADLENELAPDALADLTVLRVDELNSAGDKYEENFLAMAKPYGADELREVAILYGTSGGPALGGMELLRYGDTWYVWNLTSALMGTGIGSIEPTSEQDYLDAVAEVRS